MNNIILEDFETYKAAIEKEVDDMARLSPQLKEVLSNLVSLPAQIEAAVNERDTAALAMAVQDNAAWHMSRQLFLFADKDGKFRTASTIPEQKLALEHAQLYGTSEECTADNIGYRDAQALLQIKTARLERLRNDLEAAKLIAKLLAR